MKALEQKVKIKPDVVCRQVQGEEVILDLVTGTYFGLNEVGTRMWALMQKNNTLETIVKKISAEFDAEPNDVQSDLLQLTQNLKKRNLVDLM